MQHLYILRIFQPVQCYSSIIYVLFWPSLTISPSFRRRNSTDNSPQHMSEILDFLRTAPAPSANSSSSDRTILLSDNPPAALSTTQSATQQLFNLASAVPTAQSLTDADLDTLSAASLTTLLRRKPLTKIPSQSSAHLPRSTLPLHPVEYLTTLIDSVSPLVKIRQQRGLAGGGASTPIPVPLGVRQRRRQAIQWILAVADNRRETNLSERVAKELLKVADGTSGVWERRAMVHRLAVTARSNIAKSLKRR